MVEVKENHLVLQVAALGCPYMGIYVRINQHKLMNADLTFNSIVFKKSYDSDGKSLRQSTTRAQNTPDELIIRSQPYVDSATKVAGFRYTFGVYRTDILALDGTKYVSSVSSTIQVPGLALTADITTLVATFKAAVADANLIAAILNNEK